MRLKLTQVTHTIRQALRRTGRRTGGRLGCGVSSYDRSGFTGWESGSDAALRDELKRIRDTGFGVVRVRFDRDGDIRKVSA